MVDLLERWVLVGMDRESSWVGVRWLKPLPDRPYTSWNLLKLSLVLGIPGALITYGLVYVACLSLQGPLVPVADWLPRVAAWTMFVANGLLQSVGRWLWNRRAARLNPSAFRYRGRASADQNVTVS